MTFFRRRNSRKFKAFSGPRMAIERLEPRTLMTQTAVAAVAPSLDESLSESVSPAIPQLYTRAAIGSESNTPPVVPAFSSLPTAKANLYLDFDGNVQGRWGIYRNIVSPRMVIRRSSARANWMRSKRSGRMSPKISPRSTSTSLQ